MEFALLSGEHFDDPIQLQSSHTVYLLCYTVINPQSCVQTWNLRGPRAELIQIGIDRLELDGCIDLIIIWVIYGIRERNFRVVAKKCSTTNH